MAKIELTNDQLKLIQEALELYARIGTLHFDVILDHPTVDNCLTNQFTIKKELEVGDDTMRGEIVEIGENYIKTKGSWGSGEDTRIWTDIENIKLSPDWSKIHKKQDIIQMYFNDLKRQISEISLGDGGNLGIHNKLVDESCRQAFDIVQLIRHEFWKENPNRSSMTVNSSVSFTTSQPTVKVELDDIKDIRKRKIEKMKSK